MESTTLSLDELAEGPEFEIEVDDFGFRGEGYTRVADGWVSVPGALPGERVLAAPRGPIGRGRRLYAHVVEVRESSADRIPLDCAVADVCGGCQMRHASTPAEFGFLRRRIRETFQKFGGIDTEPYSPIEILGTDRSGRLRADLRSDGEGLGLFSRLAGGIVDTTQCPALARDVRERVGAAGDAIVGQADVRLRFYPAGVVVDCEDPATRAELLGLLPDSVAEPAELLEQTEVGGLTITSNPATWSVTSTVHRDVLYPRVLSWLLDDPASTLVELGCGVGTLSLLAATKCAAVSGVDMNLDAIELARRNATANGIENATFIAGRFEKALRGMLSNPVDQVVINPMREPVGERVLALVQSLRPRQIIYLGPSPEAAAKDVSAAMKLGYAIDELVGFNLQPATYHVMAGVRLSRVE